MGTKISQFNESRLLLKGGSEIKEGSEMSIFDMLDSESSPEYLAYFERRRKWFEAVERREKRTGLRRCNKCGEHKPISEFDIIMRTDTPSRKTRKWRKWCKKCRSEGYPRK